MNWFLYDRDLFHERVEKAIVVIFKIRKNFSKKGLLLTNVIFVALLAFNLQRKGSSSTFSSNIMRI